MSQNDNNNPNDDTRDGLEKAADKLSGFFGKLTQQIGNGATLPADVSSFLRAVKMGKIEEIKRVIAEGKINLNTRNGGGDTALHICAKNNQTAVAALLLDAGANPRLGSADDEARTPLDDAVNFGRIEMVELLTRHGGYVQGNTTGGRTLLHRACEKGKTRMVEALIRAGASANEPTENGTTPLLITLSYRQSDVAIALLSFPEVAQGINTFFTQTDPLQRNAFQIAVDRGLTDVAAHMIKLGATVNTPDAEGTMPLARAIEQANPAMVALLARHGATLNKSDSATAQQATLPLLLACATKEIPDDKTRAAIVETLLATGADPELRNAAGQTALHAALLAAHGQGSVMALLAAGANPDVREMQGGQTPLMLAVQQKSAEAVTALLAAGANPKLTDATGKSALSYARALNSGEGDMNDIINAITAALDARAKWPKPDTAQKSAAFNAAAEQAAAPGAENAPASADPAPQDKPKPGKKSQSWDL